MAWPGDKSSLNFRHKCGEIQNSKASPTLGQVQAGSPGKIVGNTLIKVDVCLKLGWGGLEIAG